MPTWKELFQHFRTQNLSAITLDQLEELRNGLKNVKPEEITSERDAKNFLELLRGFREGVAKADKLHGENYPKLLNALLSVGEDGLYSDKLRFIFELIQNVDDCEFPDTDDRKLTIHFDSKNGKIVLEYNEAGFTPFNVFAITGIAEAAKNISAGKSEIGEKGIGFKSVFGVTQTVTIRSGYFSFKLCKDNFTIPIADYPQDGCCSGTRMTLNVPGDRVQSIYDEIRKQYCSQEALFHRNPLLFLNKLTALKIYYDEKFRSLEFHVQRTDQYAKAGFWKEENVHISVDLCDQDQGMSREINEKVVCTRYSDTVTFSDRACRARYGADIKIGGGSGRQMKLQVLFPHPDFLEKVGTGALYSFLPTQIRFSVPVVCHVPFKLDASREFVDPQGHNLWFQEGCKYLSELLDYAYQDWARTVKNEIVAYLPRQEHSLFAENNGKEKCLSEQAVFKGAHFSAFPLFYTVKGNYARAEQVFCFDRTENIFQPERAYKLLRPKKELFLPPPGKQVFGIGIRAEKNVYLRLFGCALKEPERTADILDYLDAAGYTPGSEDSLKECAELRPEQISRLMSFPRFAALFEKYASDCLKKPMRPHYSVDAPELMNIQAVLCPDFKLTDAPSIVEKYLNFCQGKCVLLDIGADQYFPCKNALGLSQTAPLSSFAAFCYAVDENNTFSIRMKYREISNKLNQLTASDQGSARGYLKELRNHRLAVKDVLGDRAYGNYIDLILRAGTDPVRFVQELLQNADDCEYPAGVIPEFSLKSSSSRIVTCYNEVGFTRENIRAITAIGESTKNLLLSKETDKIGEKGVGFKTVFAAASSVKVHSGPYHFSLAAETPTIPEILDAAGEDVGGTRMELMLKEKIRLPDYRDEQRLLELCLCLRKLRKIQINDTIVTIHDAGDTRTITIDGKPHQFKRFVHAFSADDEALKERENGLRSISRQQSIMCYVPEKNIAKYSLYSGLPTKHHAKIPLVIDAPFMLTTSREEIETGSSKWNDRVRKEMYMALIAVMHGLKHTGGYKILRFLRFVPERRGNQTVYVNDMFDCDYLNRFDFLSYIQTEELLPTFDQQVFMSARQSRARWFPDVVNYLFSLGYFGGILPSKALNIPESYAPVLNALGCKMEEFPSFIYILYKNAGKFMEDNKFRKELYGCLQNVPDQYRPELRKLPIIPVYRVSGPGIKYVSWQEGRLFVKKGCESSEPSYDILNEKVLPKSDCERILGVNINEMNGEWERNRYNDELRRILHGRDMNKVYDSIRTEFSRGMFDRYRSWEILKGMREYIPLKNQLGEITDTGLFVCEQEYFHSDLIRGISVHGECKELANRLGFPNLSGLHYDDIEVDAELTGEDVRALMDDYFKNGAEIIWRLYRNGRISDELITEYNLEYITMRTEQEDMYCEFPEEPVRSMERLKRHMQSVLCDPPRIVAKEEVRTVRKVRESDGTEKGLDTAEIREQTMRRYTPQGKYGFCFCQLCGKLKSYQFIEVNHIMAEPKYFFAETRVVLCLECSKRFEALRGSSRGREFPFITALRNAKIGSGGTVDVPLNKTERIRFTAVHLAEIQEILRNMPDN